MPKRKPDKKKGQKKQDRDRSRQNRNFVRNSLREYLKFRRDNGQLLFVMGDTENMETILLKRINLGQNRTLLTLPSVNDWIENEYLDREYPGTDEESTNLSDDNFIAQAVQDYYSIKSDEVMVNKEVNLMIFRNCKITKENGLIPVNVRPYDFNTWYNGEALTMGETRIYGGKKLKTFFRLDDEDSYSKTYVLQDTILEILYYKGLMGKIDKNKLISDISDLARKKYWTDIAWYGFFHDDSVETKKRFENEEEENNSLNI